MNLRISKLELVQSELHTILNWEFPIRLRPFRLPIRRGQNPVIPSNGLVLSVCASPRLELPWSIGCNKNQPCSWTLSHVTNRLHSAELPHVPILTRAAHSIPACSALPAFQSLGWTRISQRFLKAMRSGTLDQSRPDHCDKRVRSGR